MARKNERFADRGAKAAEKVAQPKTTIPTLGPKAVSGQDETSRIASVIDQPYAYENPRGDGYANNRGSNRNAHPHRAPRPGPHYVCHRCNKPGHWIDMCPTNGDPSFDKVRVRAPTGIPRSMLRNVDAPSNGTGLRDSSGNFVTLQPNEEEFARQTMALRVSMEAANRVDQKADGGDIKKSPKDEPQTQEVPHDTEGKPSESNQDSSGKTVTGSTDGMPSSKMAHKHGSGRGSFRGGGSGRMGRGRGTAIRKAPASAHGAPFVPPVAFPPGMLPPGMIIPGIPPGLGRGIVPPSGVAPVGVLPPMIPPNLPSGVQPPFPPFMPFPGALPFGFGPPPQEDTVKSNDAADASANKPESASQDGMVISGQDGVASAENMKDSESQSVHAAEDENDVEEENREHPSETTNQDESSARPASLSPPESDNEGRRRSPSKSPVRPHSRTPPRSPRSSSPWPARRENAEPNRLPSPLRSPSLRRAESPRKMYKASPRRSRSKSRMLDPVKYPPQRSPERSYGYPPYEDSEYRKPREESLPMEDRGRPQRLSVDNRRRYSRSPAPFQERRLRPRSPMAGRMHSEHHRRPPPTDFERRGRVHDDHLKRRRPHSRSQSPYRKESRYNRYRSPPPRSHYKRRRTPSPPRVLKDRDDGRKTRGAYHERHHWDDGDDYPRRSHREDWKQSRPDRRDLSPQPPRRAGRSSDRDYQERSRYESPDRQNLSRSKPEKTATSGDELNFSKELDSMDIQKRDIHPVESEQRLEMRKRRFGHSKESRKDVVGRDRPGRRAFDADTEQRYSRSRDRDRDYAGEAGEYPRKRRRHSPDFERRKRRRSTDPAGDVKELVDEHWNEDDAREKRREEDDDEGSSQYGRQSVHDRLGGSRSRDGKSANGRVSVLHRLGIRR
eukprot:Plantae.Rhodophyta-Hildenbrandia_rubra.ctg2223.p1 GENE.Plantae.Rhodophyta-Hildenbrandia_rubra.ctg2223~~Plantae.Rhodophyta-Hildenbrandia_rubra.ctg2223.p1  ORF type:complete len:929 (+),score=156.80 Plantae.Rhodophyta-Hildenbrandia_rubra.ctg2223:104-2788(+)